MEEEVLFEERGNIGLITLNRPKALNSLTTNMCTLIRDKLEAWRLKPSVKAVVVVGAGEKAFCAGGDVVKVSNAYKENGGGSDFFLEEYQMNVAIAEFPKPYVSLVDGFVMGGGVGVSIPGDFWVATEKTMFAMPETALGLFPDVGGGWFLPRLPGETGMFLALTGARLKAPDLYALGIASHVVQTGSMNALLDALATADISENSDVKEVLDGFHSDPEPAPLSPHFEDIDDHFDQADVESIIASLKADESEWAQKQAEKLGHMSPFSLKVTFKQLRCGMAMESFRENMNMEYRMASNILSYPDFHEGVRAILIDKDHNPKWSPASLEDVCDSDVDSVFAPLAGGDLFKV